MIVMQVSVQIGLNWYCTGTELGNNLKNKDNLKNTDDLKNEDNLKNVDYHCCPSFADRKIQLQLQLKSLVSIHLIVDTHSPSTNPYQEFKSEVKINITITATLPITYLKAKLASVSVSTQ